MVLNASSDQELWNSVQEDDAQAFEAVVSRHQTAVSAVTFSCLGDFAASEDIAQETFLVAWQGRNTLEDTNRLRAWLCGIARNLSKNYVRKIAKQRARTQQVASEAPTADLNVPEARAMEQEEQTLVWQTLESISETYREPLVLFYREGQSVAKIAESLNISQDAAKQRLARGRNLLKDSVAKLVGDALEQTRPGKSFTSDVMAAIAIGGSTATAAKSSISGVSAIALAAKMAKLLNATKVASAGVITSGGAIGLLGGLGGATGGLAGGWLGGWLPAQMADTDEERLVLEANNRRILKLGLLFTLLTLLCAGLFALPNGAVIGLVALGCNMAWFSASTIWLTLRSLKHARELVKQTGGTPNSSPYKPALQKYSAGFTGRNFRSKLSFLGLPLVDVRVSDIKPGSQSTEYKTARGWIAVGDRAYGILVGIGRSRACGLFAMGGLAVGGIAIGGISVGMLSLGGLTAGVLAMGGVNVGAFAAGGISFAIWQAVAAIAIAGKVAVGAVACSFDVALGGFAAATEFATGAVAYAKVTEFESVMSQLKDTWAWKLAEWPSHSPITFAMFIACVVVISIAHPFVLYRRQSVQSERPDIS